ncbi:MAG: leucyl aminopeptidase [Polyangiales bacterium]
MGDDARWTVYLLRCADGSLYAGVTVDLAARVAAHNAGRGAKYTRAKRPVTVAWWRSGLTRGAALRAEIALKGLSRAEKLRLAGGDEGPWDRLFARLGAWHHPRPASAHSEAARSKGRPRMKIALGATGTTTAVELLAVLVTEEELADDALVSALDDALGGSLRAAVKDEEFTARKDTSLSVATYGKLTPRKVVLLGLGPEAKVGAIEVRAAAARAAKTANTEKATSVGLALRGKGDAAEVEAAATGLALGAYRFTKYLSGDRKPKKEIDRAVIGWRGQKDAKASAEQKRALHRGEALAAGINLARDLVNEPPNELTPARLADVAAEVAREGGLTAKVLDLAQIRKAGMKLIDAVGRGSSNEPRFVHLTYKPEKARKGRKRVVLVGKGLCFDSGGLCIKPAAGMGDMKSDMGGAALAVGAMKAVAALKPDVEVHALIAAAENMPDGNAYRPGDIWGSLDGRSVEIINTDAEGRLVLADALAYGRKLDPDVIIDHATLTGACLVALGTLTAGFYSNDEGLSEQYLAAAKGAGEAMWRMPLLEEMRDSLKSDVADLKHTGERYGGSITAALFLREFIGDAKWVHLDIAGPAFLDRVTALGPKGGTGYGVATFVKWVESL